MIDSLVSCSSLNNLPILLCQEDVINTQCGYDIRAKGVSHPVLLIPVCPSLLKRSHCIYVFNVKWSSSSTDKCVDKQFAIGNQCLC